MLENPSKNAARVSDYAKEAATYPALSDPTHQLLLGAVLVALALDLVLYCVGFEEGQGKLDLLRTNDAAQLRSAWSQVKQAQTRIVALETRSKILEAQGWLYRSTMELDRSNIGLAKRDIKTAESIFRTIHPVSGSTNLAALKALQEELITMTLPATADRDGLRGRIGKWNQQANALLAGQTAQVGVREAARIMPTSLRNGR